MNTGILNSQKEKKNARIFISREASGSQESDLIPAFQQIFTWDK